MIVTGGVYGGGYNYYGGSYYDDYDYYTSTYSQYGYAGFKREYDKAYYPSTESPCLPDDLECQKDSETVGWIGFAIFAAIVCVFFCGGGCLKCCKNKRSYSSAVVMTAQKMERRDLHDSKSSHSSADHKNIDL